MQQDESFYITLPSNGDEKYTRNRPTNYTTDLSGDKLLTDWEVGLQQIQFTHDWNYSTPEFKFLAWIGKHGYGYTRTYPANYVVSDLEEKLGDIGSAHITSTEEHEGERYTPTNVITRLVTIPAFNDWRHVDELGASVASRIENAFEEDEDDITVSYERTSANTTLFRVAEKVKSVGRGSVFIGISSIDDEMFKILGIHPRRESALLSVPRLKVYLFGEKHPIPRSHGFHGVETIFVYCDACEEQVIGTRSGTLLKLVPVTAGKGLRQCNEYEQPTYVPVAPTRLNKINMKLCDLAGEELRITNPETLVTVHLHFRRRKRPDYASGWC
jgi:hypothetical protein